MSFFTTDNISFRQFTNTTDVNPTHRVQPNETIFVRNILLGSTGVLFNVTAIAFLCFKKNFKLSLRVTLIGLALNDLFFTVDAMIYCNPDLRWATDAPYCWPVMYVMASSLLVSFLITTLLAFHNYVAIVHPLHCDVILPSGRSLAAVVCCWIAGYLTVLACLGTSLPLGSPCFAIVVMPRSGLVVQCTLCLICAGVVVVFNVIICVTIRNRRKINLGVHGGGVTAHLHNQVQIPNLISEVCVAAVPITEKRQCGVGRSRHRIAPASVTPAFEIPRKVSNWFEGMGTNDKQASNNLNKLSNKNMFPKISMKDFAKKTGIDLRENKSHFEHENALHRNKFNERNSSKSKHRSIDSLSVSEKGKPRSAMSVSSITSYNNASSSSEPQTSSRGGFISHTSSSNAVSTIGDRTAADCSRHDRKPLRRTSVSVTLIVLTCWSSLLILPLAIFMIYVAILIPDRKKFPQSDFGKLTASILSAHCIGNPLLYGWRFISWKFIYRFIISKLHRRR